MDRRLILDLIDPARQRGLEIGALDRPVVSRAMGDIGYVDRTSRAELLKWYADPAHAIDRAGLVDVDYVWGDETLLEAVGGQRTFDYVIASHVIEHVPDMYGWLVEIAAVLRDGGLGLFMVPDKRFTFDWPRPISTRGEFVDAHVRGLRRPDTRQIFNHAFETRPDGTPDRDDAAWTTHAQGCVALCRQAHADQSYIDAHCWVFTPRSMLDALDLFSRLDLAPFEVAALTPTPAADAEFLLALRRLPEDLDAATRRARFRASVETLDLPDELIVDSAPEALAEAQAAIARAAAIENSTTWRATAPIRRLVNRLRAGR
ncbi:MAG: methyltransferase domain-containing protein [Phenylobacterium sp.]|nr:methyltransferase domain-containing protein [Phenylobacterium sp.]